MHGANEKFPQQRIARKREPEERERERAEKASVLCGGRGCLEACVGKIRIFKRKKAKGRENSFLNPKFMNYDR